MHRIPKNLDLSPVVGEFTSQIGIGPGDFQIAFGPVHFSVYSPIKVLREGEVVAKWTEGSWPTSGFYEILNAEVLSCKAINDRQIVFDFVNGLSMVLEDDTDQYESFQIIFKGESDSWII